MNSEKVKKPVSILWGLPDTGTVVGKLFGYRIPDDAFDGTIREYLVRTL